MATDSGPRAWVILASSIVASMAGSGGGVAVYLHNVGEQQIQRIARPDPATGSDLAQLRQELYRHLNSHPDAVQDFNARITRLETKLDFLIDHLGRK